MMRLTEKQHTWSDTPVDITHSGDLYAMHATDRLIHTQKNAQVAANNRKSRRKHSTALTKTAQIELTDVAFQY